MTPTPSQRRFVLQGEPAGGADRHILDDSGEVAYSVPGPRSWDRAAGALLDRDERPVAVLTERLAARDSALIDRPGHPLAQVRRQLSPPGKDLWQVEAGDSGELLLVRDTRGGGSTLWQMDRMVASVVPHGPRTRVLTVHAGIDPVLVLSAVVAIDGLIH